MAANLYQQRKICGINQQILKEFLPAARDLTTTGNNLLIAYKNFNKTLLAHIDSLDALSSPNKENTDETSKEQSRIQNAVKVYRSICDDETKRVDELGRIIFSLMNNCDSEKERLKNLVKDFHKKEKVVRRAVAKGKETSASLNDFYARELEEMTNQQSLRYKFVADKYCSLIEKQYKDCSNSTINHILQVFPAVAEQQKNEASDEKMEQTHPPTKKEEIPSHPNIQCGYRSNTAEPQNSGGEDLIRIRTAAVKVRPNTTYFGDYTSAQTLQHGWIQQQNFTSKLKRHSLAQVPLYASDGADYYLRTTPQRGNNFIQGRTTLNGAANNGLGLGLTQQTAYEPGTGFGSDIGVAGNDQRFPQHQNPHQYSDYSPAAPFVTPPPSSNDEINGVLKRVTTQQHQNEALVVDNGLADSGYAAQNFAVEHSPAADFIDNYQQQYQQQGSNERRFSGASKKSSFEQRRHGRQLSQSTGSLAKVIQAPFIPSDYGRLCECTTGYTAQGDNQLTIVVGERVILLKCGTRGWALCRSEDGTKHGWFPAKYLRLMEAD